MTDEFELGTDDGSRNFADGATWEATQKELSILDELGVNEAVRERMVHDAIGHRSSIWRRSTRKIQTERESSSRSNSRTAFSHFHQETQRQECDVNADSTSAHVHVDEADEVYVQPPRAIFDMARYVLDSYGSTS